MHFENLFQATALRVTEITSPPTWCSVAPGHTVRHAHVAVEWSGQQRGRQRDYNHRGGLLAIPCCVAPYFRLCLAFWGRCVLQGLFLIDVLGRQGRQVSLCLLPGLFFVPVQGGGGWWGTRTPRTLLKPVEGFESCGVFSLLRRKTLCMVQILRNSKQTFLRF